MFTPNLKVSFMGNVVPQDVSGLTLSDKGKTTIELDEGGNRSKVYPDSQGNPTAGVGHLLSPGENKQYPMGAFVPKIVRDGWFASDLGTAQNVVKNLVKAPLTQPQFDAMVNFAFQMGGDHLVRSNLLRDVNGGAAKFGIPGSAPTFDQINRDFHGWNLGGPGIPLRRDREINLFNNGIYPYGL